MINAIQQSVKATDQESLKETAVTRRTVLTRNLRAISAIAAVPAMMQIIAPKSAFARFGGDDDGGDGHGWFGGDRDGGDHDGHGPHGGRSGGGNCFLRGTRISTATGERRVEDIAVGDLVPTVFGGTQPIKWIGRFRRVRSDAAKPWARVARPVRVARSALAPNVPRSDLYVTQGHALLIDDLLIPAKSLINGTTISLDSAEAHNELEFFCIKLETHDAIYAEGAPCETLLRIDETMSYFGDYVRQHGATVASEQPCAAIVCNGRRSELKTAVRSLLSPWLGPQKLDTIRARLRQRAMAMNVTRKLLAV